MSATPFAMAMMQGGQITYIQFIWQKAIVKAVL